MTCMRIGVGSIYMQLFPSSYALYIFWVLAARMGLSTSGLWLSNKFMYEDPPIHNSKEKER